jgi:hypothetical protein
MYEVYELRDYEYDDSRSEQELKIWETHRGNPNSKKLSEVTHSSNSTKMTLNLRQKQTGNN